VFLIYGMGQGVLGYLLCLDAELYAKGLLIGFTIVIWVCAILNYFFIRCINKKINELNI